MLESQFEKISENINRVLRELDATEVEGSAGGGAVKVRMTGNGDVLAVEISPAAVEANDIELLQDLVCAAVRDASAKSTELKREKVLGATPLGALGANMMPDMF